MEFRLVYVTVSNREEARRIGKQLIAERLVACVNILDGMNSLYWWKGEIQDDNETVLIAKTKAELAERLIEKIKTLHSYEVPCVLCLPIQEGNPAFLSWIQEETK